MKTTERVNIVLHRLMRRYVAWRYCRLIKTIKGLQPQHFTRSVPAETVKKHIALWAPLGVPVDIRWLQYNINVSGIVDHRYCPSATFFGVIERIFNECDCAGYNIEDKNEQWRFLPKGSEPKAYLRFIHGCFYDGEGKWIGYEGARQMLSNCRFDLVGKGCRSCGGKQVKLFSWNGCSHRHGDVELTPEWIAGRRTSYVVQERLDQCDFSASFNASSINTVRLMTMRCPWDGKIVPLKMVMRMGVGDGIIDNLSSGGVCVSVGPGGVFGSRAYDDYGKVYDRHPSSGKAFVGVVHPYYDSIIARTIEAHERVPFMNLLSFDLVVRADGRVCIVEVNPRSQGIDMMEHDFGPLFGDYTEKVVEWCVAHKELDTFQHIRTWY